MPDISVKWWMGKGELAKLARALSRYWEQVANVLKMPLEQHDPLTAPMGIVELLAWQRGITRFERETEPYFRLRVAYAFEFAQKAGETKGFAAIFSRLGIPLLEQRERVPGWDWDVVALEVSPAQFVDKDWLVIGMVDHYGRTCRRYEIGVSHHAQLKLLASEFSNEWGYDQASCEIVLEHTDRIEMNSGSTEFSNDSALVYAR